MWLTPDFYCVDDCWNPPGTTYSTGDLFFDTEASAHECVEASACTSSSRFGDPSHYCVPSCIATTYIDKSQAVWYCVTPENCNSASGNYAVEEIGANANECILNTACSGILKYVTSDFFCVVNCQDYSSSLYNDEEGAY